MSETKKSNFEEIQRSETKEAIIPRRNKKFPNLVNKHVDNEDIRENPEDLVGLALSGGGIRSAMFNLGLLRAMKQSGFLRYVDYISSVSGGGYISAYYAAIGHYRDKQKESELNDKQDDKQDELSKFDDSFLVDGKYLLDLFTVPTTYLFATIPYFITVLSFLIILSSSIAWLFRLFDYPHARRWLQLLDLKTDLQVGIFASCIVLVVFCLLSCALYCRNYISRILSKSSGLAWEPRKPSLITKASLLAGVACFFCGCAVMIGNGDFDFSASPLATSNKINLRGLILPIAAVILVLFFPLIRARPLARSERAAGTSWKQILVFIASYGTVLGSIFVALCIMGSENISGFIGRRPPTLQKHDVHDIQLLASLSKDPAIDSRLKKMDSKHCGSVFPRYATPPDEINIDKLIEVINEIADSRFQEELNLWPEKKFDDTLAREQYPKDRDYETTWTWTGYQSTPIRWFNTLCGALNFNTKAKAYVNYDRDLFEVHGPHLLHRFNLAIKPIYLRKTQVDCSESDVNEDFRFTRHLLCKAATRANLAISDPPPLKDFPKCDENICKSDLQCSQCLNILGKWAFSGGPMPRQSQSDPISFRDLREFKTIINKLTSISQVPISAKKATETEACCRCKYLDISVLTPTEHWHLNRLLLEIAYPEVFKEQRWISTSVVVHEDQCFRLVAIMISLVLCLIFSAMVDLNTQSLTPFYRQRLLKTFIAKPCNKKNENSSREIDDAEYGDISLSELKVPSELSKDESWNQGCPYPLFVGALRIPHQETAKPPSKGTQGDPALHRNPSKLDGSYGSQWYSFLMSPLYVGFRQFDRPQKSESKTYVETKAYLADGLMLSDAVAISGAAFSSYMTDNLCLRFLMKLFGVRLEQWVPNPLKTRQTMPKERGHLTYSLWQYFKAFISSPNANGDPLENWDHGIVADGGFRDFLGVEELVARRCRVIVAVDAGCNNGLYEFGVLADLIRLLRLDHGVELLDLDHDKPIDTKRLVRLDSPDSLSPQHFILGRIKYPKDEGIQTGLFVYVQMSLTGDEEIDLAQFKKTNPRFPDEPIINQFYSKDQVESFRQLGEHIGKMLCWDIEEYKENTSNPNVTYTKLIDRVDLAFREAYRNECRQEHIVASDDARMGWHINGELPNIEVIKHIREYESAEHTDYQNRIKNYVAWCTDGATPPRDRREFNEVLARDIFPIAIECNRRHSGFRSEWPTSYFQINGRDTLMRVTKGFLDLLEITNDEDKNEDKRLSRHEKSVLNLTTRDEVTDKLAEIAVILQRAVFRLEGASTASDLIICLLHLWVDRESVDTLPESAMWLLINKLRSEENRVKVRKAVETGNRFEVKTVLQQIVRSVN